MPPLLLDIYEPYDIDMAATRARCRYITPAISYADFIVSFYLRLPPISPPPILIAI